MISTPTSMAQNVEPEDTRRINPQEDKMEEKLMLVIASKVKEYIKSKGGAERGR